MSAIIRHIFPNGNATTKRSLDEQKKAEDAIADLADYCRNPATGQMTEEAQTTITAVNNLYRCNMVLAALPAFRGLEKLRRRNSDTFGEDIPINHLTVYKNFRDVIETLLYRIEQDFDSELKRQRGKE